MVLLGRYTPAFQVYSNRRAPLPDWQQEQLEHYATDGTSVYFEKERLAGADPKQFSAYFPFGNDEKWHRFYFSRSGSIGYLAGSRLPDVDFAQVAILEPTRCPGHGLRCTLEYSLDCDHGYWGCSGLLGRAGKDVVYLQWDGATSFGDLANDDLFMFMTSKRMYFHSGGAFYEVVPDGLKRSATLAQMDVATYEAEP